MNRKSKILICLLSVLMLSTISAATKKSNSKVVVTGYVVSKGSMPFVYPVIRTQDDSTEYMLVCNDKTKQKLLNNQGYLIKFTGTINEDGFFVLKKWKRVK